MTTLNPEEVRKIDSVIKSGVEMKERQKLERESLKEAVDAVAADVGIKPKSINAAIRIAFKADYQSEVEAQEEVTSILESTGRIS